MAGVPCWHAYDLVYLVCADATCFSCSEDNQTRIAVVHCSAPPHVKLALLMCTWLVFIVMAVSDNSIPASADAGMRFCRAAKGKRIALDVAQGLDFLHSRNIVHFE